ncbi:alpha/beta hydrolase [Streptomyces carpaticus]|uniref:Alpha/beta hydrolase n=1 Tax=Streptomyces carpaticus TaxID=285558 RepID=A0ABV4ZIC1_9ACTN
MTRFARSLPLLTVGALLLTAACSAETRTEERPSPSPSAGDEPGGGGPEGADGGSAGDAPVLDPLPEEVPADLQPYYEQELTWRGCPGVPGFQCAVLTVPLDYESVDPADDIQLTVTRARAGGADRLGALLMNPGGPGASAVEFAQDAANYIFPAEVREQYDMVGLDARGTGGSEPIECLSGPEMDAATQVDRTPDDEEEMQALLTAHEEFAAGCQANSGRLLEHISTIESARDMDVLRSVLGDERLHYVGFSYGTKLGAVYAGLFPQRVGHLVLDAAVDPRLSTLDLDREQAGGFETAFRSFAADCASRRSCPLGGEGGDDASAKLLAFFTELDATPLETGQDRPLTESLATTGVAMALYSESLWSELRLALTAAMEDGDGAPLLALADAYNEREPDGSYGTTMFAFPAISCLDSPAATTTPEEVLAQLPDYEEASPTFGRDFAWATLLCGVWPVEPSGTPLTIPAAGADPILVIGTTRDPATPFAWAEGLADQLQSGILLTYDGDGHGAYGGGNGCVDTVVNDYLLANTTPEEGASCP